MEAEENKKFNARQLVSSFMDSSFESNPESWSELINVEKDLEKMEILTHDGEGQFSSPLVVSLKDNLEKFRKGEASLNSVEYMLSSSLDNVSYLKKLVDGMTISDSDASFVEHTGDLRKTIEIFSDFLKKIRASLHNQETCAGEFRRIEEFISAKSVALKEAKEAAGRERKEEKAATTFCMPAGKQKKIKIFSSPSFDLINNALRDYGEGSIDGSQCAAVVDEVRMSIEGLFEFFEAEMNALKEGDPESFSRYAEVVKELTLARSLMKDGMDRIQTFIKEGGEALPDKGLETFFRGIQEMATVWGLLEQIKSREMQEE